MSRANWAKWVLPDVVNPDTHTDWCIPVPNDRFHRAAFLGALAALGSAYNWSDDPDHKAKDVAKVWRDIADNLAKCQDQPSITYFTEWEDDDMSLHCNIRWQAGKLQVTNGCDCDGAPIWVDVCSDGSDGTPDSVIQQDSGTRPTPGAQDCFNRTLHVGNSWVIPFGIQNGDVIEVTNRQGAWSSNGLGWVCTDGTPFALGSCSGAPYHDGADPDATLYHGQLMLTIGAVNYSLTDGPITLSGLTGLNQGVVTGNLTPGAGAGGDISFKLCVTNGSTPPIGTWCYYQDFTLSPYDWYARDLGSGPLAIWQAGTGWVPNAGVNASAIYIERVSDPTDISGADAWYIFAGDTSGTDLGIGSNTVGIIEVDPLSSSGVVQTASGDVSVPGMDVYRVGMTGSADSTMAITALEWRGTGTNTFGSSNC